MAGALRASTGRVRLLESLHIIVHPLIAAELAVCLICIRGEDGVLPLLPAVYHLVTHYVWCSFLVDPANPLFESVGVGIYSQTDVE